MIFTATLAERSLRGHFLLQDIQAENGMHRQHCWVNQAKSSLPHDIPIPSRLRIQAQYRRYRRGPEGWTLCQIRSAEVIP